MFGYRGNAYWLRVSLKKVMKNLDEYKRRWRAIENLTGLHVVSSSLHVQEDVEQGSLTYNYSFTSLKQETSYASGENMDQDTVTYVSSESFEDYDVETMSQYSVASSSTINDSRFRGSTRSMEHPSQHLEQQQQQKKKLKNMKHSASDGKLPLSFNANMGIYQKIEEEQENDILPQSNNSPNVKRGGLFRKSKWN